MYSMASVYIYIYVGLALGAFNESSPVLFIVVAQMFITQIWLIQD